MRPVSRVPRNASTAFAMLVASLVVAQPPLASTFPHAVANAVCAFATHVASTATPFATAVASQTVSALSSLPASVRSAAAHCSAGEVFAPAGLRASSPPTSSSVPSCPWFVMGGVLPAPAGAAIAARGHGRQAGDIGLRLAPSDACPPVRHGRRAADEPIQGQADRDPAPGSARLPAVPARPEVPAPRRTSLSPRRTQPAGLRRVDAIEAVDVALGHAAQVADIAGIA
jgi:hypothetical protein